ncbi:hypothetical protein CGRA01v4_10102 [Colletotrichum graminicola]|nr:hypothetical protein CGRA01v4_10102 [Colletotrichum graminicola]
MVAARAGALHEWNVCEWVCVCVCMCVWRDMSVYNQGLVAHEVYSDSKRSHAPRVGIEPQDGTGRQTANTATPSLSRVYLVHVCIHTYGEGGESERGRRQDSGQGMALGSLLWNHRIGSSARSRAKLHGRRRGVH